MKICLVTAFPPSGRQLNEYALHIAQELQRNPMINLTVLGDELSDYQFATDASGHAIRVEDPGELSGAVKDVLAHDGPALLDVVSNPQELAMPPAIALEQAKGFGLWALRTVMNGRGDELIELAKTNLLR